MAKKTFLFSPTTLHVTSPTFYLDRPVTITATNLQDGEEILFDRITLTAGEPASVCGCQVENMRPADIESIDRLRCPTCDSEDEQFVRLNYRNPVMVLDFPLGTLLRAVYVPTEGEAPEGGIGTVLVWYDEYEGDADLPLEMRGCPPVCCMDKEETWEDTGLFRCNLEDDVKEIQQLSNCGNTRWVRPSEAHGTPPEDDALNWQDSGEFRCDIEQDAKEIKQVNECGDIRWVAGGPLTWTDTGQFRCDPITDVKEIQQVNECGDTRWIAEAEALVWSYTGDFRCDIETDLKEFKQTTDCGNIRWVIKSVGDGVGDDGGVPLPTDYLTWTATGVLICSVEDDIYIIQEVNDCGNTRWTPGGPLVWTPTENKRCNYVTRLVEQAEETSCGDVRWVATTNPCGYFATIPLPDGGLMYEDGRQHPGATVAVKNCEDGVLGWIYPDPVEGATTPVFIGCDGGCGLGDEILGYAVDGGYQHQPLVRTETRVTHMPKQAVGTFETEDSAFIKMLWSDGSITVTKQRKPECCPAGGGGDIDELLAMLRNGIGPYKVLTTNADGVMVWQSLLDCNNESILN